MLLFTAINVAACSRYGEDDDVPGFTSFIQIDMSKSLKPLSLMQVSRSPTRVFEYLKEGRVSVPERTELLESNFAVLHVPEYGHIAVNVTYHNLRERILTFPERRPREFNVMLATMKTWSADAVVQLAESRRSSSSIFFDWQRSAAFAVFGFLYIGVAQWFLYVSVLTWLFPDAMIFANSPLEMKLRDQTGMIDMAGQIFVDNFVFAAMIYFPAFYMIKAVVQGSGSLPVRIQTGLTKYRANWMADNMASCMLWMPLDVIIFACPMYLRMPMEHAVSFGWTMFISAMRGSVEPKVESKSESKC